MQGLERSSILRNPIAVVSLAFIVALVVAAVAGPERVTGWDPNAPNYDITYQPPSRQHWAGTDQIGRDMASRLIAGARISLQIALVASIISVVVGVLWGSIAGYIGGRTDELMMRVVDVLYGIPTILVVILLMVYLEQGVGNIYVAIGLTYWLNMSRLVRGEVLALKERDFVQAARALGATSFRILGRHILPNAAGIILVTLTLFIPEAIFTEAFLSYIGLGVPAPDASWGSLAAEGTKNLRSSSYLMLIPAGCICCTMLAFNVLGDMLRDLVVKH